MTFATQEAAARAIARFVDRYCDGDTGFYRFRTVAERGGFRVEILSTRTGKFLAYV